MHPDLNALLALQSEDSAIDELETRARELEERVQQLAREQEQAAQEAERARAAAEAEERKRRDLAGKVQEHRQRQDHNLAALDAVRKLREATAATEQIELMRKVLAQEEAELHSLGGRIADLRHSAEYQELELWQLLERQRAGHEEIAATREALERELAEARARREQNAREVSPGVLAKYERIRTRARASAVYPLRGAACGRCNTAIPLQRRNVIASGRSIEVCEGCGVLLYAAV